MWNFCLKIRKIYIWFNYYPYIIVLKTFYIFYYSFNVIRFRLYQFQKKYLQYILKNKNQYKICWMKIWLHLFQYTNKYFISKWYFWKEIQKIWSWPRKLNLYSGYIPQDWICVTNLLEGILSLKREFLYEECVNNIICVSSLFLKWNCVFEKNYLFL